jgi:hypothetical protein
VPDAKKKLDWRRNVDGSWSLRPVTPQPPPRKKRAVLRKYQEDTPGTDAIRHRLPGSFEGGKRR